VTNASQAMLGGGLTWFDAAAFVLLLLFAWHGFQRGLLSWIVGVGAAILSFVLSLILSPVVAGLFVNQSPWSRIAGERIAFFGLLIGLRIVLGLALRELVGALRPVLNAIPTFGFLDHVLGVVPSLALGIVVVVLALLAALFLPIDRRLHDMAAKSYVERLALAETNKVIDQLPRSGLLANPQRILAVGQQRLHSPLAGDAH
jgi:uncharacterized membrane protein required for colicin V production